jgi:hypothetical protein
MDDDKEKAVASRKRLLDMLATDRVLVSGFHMPFPSIGYIERANGSYRWTPHGYQMNLCIEFVPGERGEARDPCSAAYR